MAYWLDLLIPGLLGPVPLLTEDLPGVPALERLLGRADRIGGPAADPLFALCRRFGIPPEPGRDTPSAPFCHLADDPSGDPTGYWLHADPIHLRPGPDQLLLIDARHLDLTQDETDELAAEINAHLVADGLHLIVPVPGRWYLRLDSPACLRTTPLHVAAGRNIGPLLPAGEDAARWIRLLNEIQMLLHHSSVNQTRERAGRLTVNGIWPWGGGRLPAASVCANYGLVQAGHPLALGLARAAGIPNQPLPNDTNELIADDLPGDRLIFWDPIWPAVLDGDPEIWVRRLERLERVAENLLAAVRNDRIARLDIDPCDGTLFRLTRRGLRRIWRRIPSFGSRLD